LYDRPLDGRVGTELAEELDEFEVAVEGGLMQTESGTVCAELLTGTRDDRFDLRQGHAELGEDVGRERLVNAEQSQEHVLVLYRPLTGVVDRVGERHLQARHDALHSKS